MECVQIQNPFDKEAPTRPYSIVQANHPVVTSLRECVGRLRTAGDKLQAFDCLLAERLFETADIVNNLAADLSMALAKALGSRFEKIE